MGRVVRSRWGQPFSATEERLAAWIEARDDDTLLVVFALSFPTGEERDDGGDVVPTVAIGHEAMMDDGRVHAFFNDVTGFVGEGPERWGNLVMMATHGWEAYMAQRGIAAVDIIGSDYAESAE